MKLMIIITMVMIIIFLEIWLSNFVQIVSLKVMFWCFEAYCSFNFADKFIPQSSNNER